MPDELPVLDDVAVDEAVALLDFVLVAVADHVAVAEDEPVSDEVALLVADNVSVAVEEPVGVDVPVELLVVDTDADRADVDDGLLPVTVLVGVLPPLLVREPVAEAVAEAVAEHEGTEIRPVVKQPAHGHAVGAVIPDVGQ